MPGRPALERMTLRPPHLATERDRILLANDVPLPIDLPSELEDVAVHVVRPGDPVRITGVLDAVHPAVRIQDPSATFPGFTGAVPEGPGTPLGFMPEVTVVATADLGSCPGFEALPDRPDGESLIDMAGPGAPYTPWSAGTVVILEFAPHRDGPVAAVDHAIRHTTLTIARDLALRGDRGDEPPVQLPAPGGDDGLPALSVVLHVGAEGPLLDTYYNGRSLRGSPPFAVAPQEILAGSLVDGSFDWAALRNPTAGYQNSRLLLRLLSGAGARCAGVVVTRAYATTYAEKLDNARAAADLAVAAGADGAVITTFQSGNSHTDTMLAIEACEERGIPTVGLIAESDDGLTDRSPVADCLASTGTESDLVPGWEPERLVGGAADPGIEPIPVLSYLGALSQLGNGRLQAVGS